MTCNGERKEKAGNRVVQATSFELKQPAFQVRDGWVIKRHGWLRYHLHFVFSSRQFHYTRRAGNVNNNFRQKD